MRTTKVLAAASMVAMMFSPVAFSANSVLGEKLDSGLGQLSASYTGAEFMKQTESHVLGEKLDSGLGQLPASYTGAEFMVAQAGDRVIGESLDSGLGQLSASYTAAEFQKQIVARR